MVAMDLVQPALGDGREPIPAAVKAGLSGALEEVVASIEV